ncbi:MAG: polysaccharide biosynthesis/export family protein [Verrucomicrobiae bacterium]|nr:polysaccharide biosynthesis/export family protein [Verrucomicrobiae bacterium]
MNIDIVIIGLNAESTLGACIESVLASRYVGGTLSIIYVDGGSTDRSREIASSYDGVKVIAIDSEHPSPGAGRNAGWLAGGAPLVQFLDSDTMVDPDWFQLAVPVMRDAGIGAVRGRRVERHPEASVYNWIADQEWNAAPGECADFGGDVLIRRTALEATGGYDEELVGGEDPELSRRVKSRGWRIMQQDTPMTSHDLAMRTAGQYWRRAYRTGYGFAAVVDRHGSGWADFWVRELVRIVVRGGLGPMLILAGALLAGLAHPAWGCLSVAGIGLLLYPRLFRVSAFGRAKGIPAAQARCYAWHCALVVLPECLGAARYGWGRLAGAPLRNRRPRPGAVLLAVSQLLWLTLAGCVTDPGYREGINDFAAMGARKSGADDPLFNVDNAFVAQAVKAQRTLASEDQLNAFSEAVPEAYLIGPGDVLEILVRERPDISVKETTVSPDGTISVPQVGILDVRGRTAAELTATISGKLARLYEEPEVTVHVHDYQNHKVFVLGRIANPGLVKFGGTGTLLEALALAGGLPTVAEEAFLSRAMIFRGQEEVIWVDLRELLQNGNLAMNPRLRNNDIVFIPESDDELVYVMGEVKSPGAVKLKTELSVLDAVMASGGPTKDAKIAKTYLIRYENGRGLVQPIDLERFVRRADLRQDYLLRDGDIVYVSERPLADINYLISSLSPSVSYLNLAALAASGM